jgi:hypothetical protein
MTDADLDLCYTRLATALGDVGAARAELFLAMVSLDLLARCEHAAEVLPSIERVRALCLQEEQANGG